MGFRGQFYMYRIFNTARTPTQLRADMFNTHGNMASTTGLQVMYQFDEGTGGAGDTVDNKEGTASRDGVLSNAGAAPNWVGAGNFDGASATLNMTGASTFINMKDDESVGNLTIATGGDSNTVTIKDIVGGNSSLIVSGTLEQTSGKLASNTSESIQFGQTYGDLKVASGKGDIAFTDVSLFYVYQNSVSGVKNLPHADSAEKDVTISKLYINSTSTIEVKATGNLSLRYHLLVGAGNTFNANGFTMSGRTIDVNGGTINLVNSTWDFTREANFGIDLTDASTLLTGNTTLNGHPTHPNKTVAYLPSAGGFELVGKISDFMIKSGGDLTVIGSVIDCEFEDSTANIRQWHHTLDTQQVLDADEAGDDDIKLPKPSLDNAHELQLGG